MNFKGELVMELYVHCDPALEIGDMFDGNKKVIPIVGGSFEGPNIKGEVLPGGADWNVTRPDGSSEVWARYTLKADDGTLISVTNQGKLVPKPSARDEDKPFNFKEDMYVYTVPSFEVANEKYNWLNNSMFIGTLDLDPKGVHLHIYKIV